MDPDPIKRWALTVLAAGQQDHATELVLSPTPEGGTSMRYKTDGAWHDWAPSPEITWAHVTAELAGLAGIRDGPFPKQGLIYLAYSGVRLRWKIILTSPDAECVLHNLGTDMI